MPMLPSGDLVSPWHPMQDACDLKHLGKFGEELGECTAAVMRCLIQGIEESEPMTGKPNRQWLEEEIADVEANIELVKRRFALDREKIETRKLRKIYNLTVWHDGLEPA